MRILLALMAVLGAGCQPPDCGLVCDAETDVLALDGDSVYWAYLTTVMATDRHTRVTREVVRLADELVTGIRVTPTSLVVSSERAFMGALWRVPKSGGEAVRLGDTALLSPITVDGANIYHALEGSLLRQPIDGSAPTALASGQLPGALAVDATHLYWIDSFVQVRRVSLQGGSVETLATPASTSLVTRLFRDGASVLWCEDDSLVAMPLAGGQPQAVGGECPALIDAGEALGATTVDTRTNAGGDTWAEIWKTPLGGTRRLVATAYTGTSSGAVVVPPLAADGTAIYWADLVRTGDDTYARGIRGVRARIAVASR